MITLTIMVAI